MYKLMVVDDEQLAIEVIKSVVGHNKSNILLYETAKSGRQAIEKAREMRPDIIIMDIHMPGINGLEAIREIKKIYNDIKFIIVSAYDYFEFAKQAVVLGVSEYLTKPLDRVKLLDVLKNIIEQLDEEKEKNRDALETREKMEEILTEIEHNFAYSLLLSEEQKVDIGRYRKLYNIPMSKGFIFVMSLHKDFDKEERASRAQDFYESLKKKIKLKMHCIVGPVILDRVVVYAFETNKNAFKQRMNTIGVLGDILNRMAKESQYGIKIGIGGIQRDEEITQSYHEAIKALNYAKRGQVVHIDDVGMTGRGLDPDILPTEDKIINGLKRGDTVLCIDLLQGIFAEHPDFLEKPSIKSKILEIMVVARRIAAESGWDEKGRISQSQFVEELMNCKNKLVFEVMCVKELKHLTEAIQKTKEKMTSDIVKKANRIIDDRFNCDLTLEDIAKELLISPQYFCRLYKSETGVNFVEQLTNVRLENAKKLISMGQYTIKEVCFMSGYSDPNYFSRLFKKHQGICPSEYQQQICLGE